MTNCGELTQQQSCKALHTLLLVVYLVAEQKNFQMSPLTSYNCQKVLSQWLSGVQLSGFHDNVELNDTPKRVPQ